MPFTLAQPWFLLLLLALPAVAWWRGRQGKPAAFLYSSVQLVKSVSNLGRSNAGRMLAALRWLALALFIIGMARPQFVESETTTKASGIDIVVAFDLSYSMAAEDFEVNGQPVNRLFIAKDVLKKFILNRPNDRIGLVAFAGKAYIASPLTLDHDFLLKNLERLNFGLIEPGTAIGSGLSAAVNRLKDINSKSKIVILMTDGQNNSGKIQPMTAAEAAQALGIKVYTIGVGTRAATVKVPVGTDPFTGQKIYRYEPVDIDDDQLTRMADRTGGKYFRADNTEALKNIYLEINRYEKSEAEISRFEQFDELFHWFVFPGLGFLLLEMLLSQTVWRRLP